MRVNLDVRPARCPAQVQSCQAIGVLSARWPAGTSRVLAYARTSAPLLLGSTSTQLRGGQASRVRIPLYTRAVDLLRRRGQLHANLQTIVRAGGRVIRVSITGWLRVGLAVFQAATSALSRASASVARS